MLVSISSELFVYHVAQVLSILSLPPFSFSLNEPPYAI